MVAVIIAEIIAAVLLACVGRYYWTHAEDFCRRGFEHSQHIRQPWRTLFYPRWFWGTSRCVSQMRATGFGSFVIAVLLLLVAALTVFCGHR